MKIQKILDEVIAMFHEEKVNFALTPDGLYYKTSIDSIRAENAIAKVMAKQDESTVYVVVEIYENATCNILSIHRDPDSAQAELSFQTGTSEKDYVIFQFNIQG